MKKKVLNANQVLAIKNAFSADGQAAADAIIAAIEAMGSEEGSELTADDVEKKVNEVIANLKDIPAPIQEMVSNAIELKMKAVANTFSKQGISREVKNQAAQAILNAHSADEVRDGLNAVAVKNGINGLTFADVVDYSIADKFGDENALFSKLRKVEITKFFYSEEDMKSKTAIAKKHTKGAEKAIETIIAKGKTMTPEMVYKRQQIDVADMIRLKKAGRDLDLIAYITEELRRVLTNTEVMAILVGDTVNDAKDRVTCFETIKKNASDVFTIVSTAASQMPTVTEVRNLVDQVLNPNGYEVVAVMNKRTMTTLAGFTYATGGDTHYRTRDELAGQLGVDSIYNTNLLADGEVIILIPEEYYVHNEGEVEVVYDRWENNQHNWQYERMDCGAIHGLLSTAYLKPAEASSSAS